MAKKIIPKTLHYAWFGGNEKPDKIKYCIESWHKHLDGWNFIEWNEDNFNVEEIPFAYEAYKRKRWAFVSDVVRIKSILDYGGVYCDSDVELVKPLDKFLSHRAFTGKETHQLTLAAVMGAEKGHSWLQTIMRYYLTAKYSEIPNTQIVTQINKQLFVKEDRFGYVYLKDGVVIYPPHVFASFDHRKLRIIPHSDAYAYHHFAGSWTSRSK